MTPEETVAVARANIKTHEEIVIIARTAAKAAVSELLLTLGVDASDPQQIIKMQRDFSNLRSWGDSIDMVRIRALGAAVVIVITGLLGMIAISFKGH